MKRSASCVEALRQRYHVSSYSFKRFASEHGTAKKAVTDLPSSVHELVLTTNLDRRESGIQHLPSVQEAEHAAGVIESGFSECIHSPPASQSPMDFTLPYLKKDPVPADSPPFPGSPLPTPPLDSPLALPQPLNEVEDFNKRILDQPDPSPTLNEIVLSSSPIRPLVELPSSDSPKQAENSTTLSPQRYFCTYVSVLFYRSSD